MNIINATPHTITIVTPDGNVEIPTSSMVLRCATEIVAQQPIEFSGVSISVSATTYGSVETLDGTPIPTPQHDVIYVVSALVRLAAPDRVDFYSPGQLVRGPDGQPTGCQGLSK